MELVWVPYLVFMITIGMIAGHFYVKARYLKRDLEFQRQLREYAEARLKRMSSSSSVPFTLSTTSSTASGMFTTLGGPTYYVPSASPDACEHCGEHHVSVTDAITFHRTAQFMYESQGLALRALDEQRIVDALSLIAPKPSAAATGWAKVKGLSTFPKP